MSSNMGSSGGFRLHGTASELCRFFEVQPDDAAQLLADMLDSANEHRAHDKPSSSVLEALQSNAADEAHFSRIARRYGSLRHTRPASAKAALSFALLQQRDFRLGNALGAQLHAGKRAASTDGGLAAAGSAHSTSTLGSGNRLHLFSDHREPFSPLENVPGARPADPVPRHSLFSTAASNQPRASVEFGDVGASAGGRHSELNSDFAAMLAERAELTARVGEQPWWRDHRHAVLRQRFGRRVMAERSNNAMLHLKMADPEESRSHNFRSAQFPSLDVTNVAALTAALMNDIFSVLRGIRGDYIRIEPAASVDADCTNGSRAPDDSCSESDGWSGGYDCKAVAVRLLPQVPAQWCDMARSFLPAFVADFGELLAFQTEYGNRTQGGCARAMACHLRRVTRDYTQRVEQLRVEHAGDGFQRDQGLGPMKLRHELQHQLDMVAQMAAACRTVRTSQLVGGELLSALYQVYCESMCESRAVHDAMLQLLVAAAQPFFKQLRLWLTAGVLSDRALEFMIWDTLGDAATAEDNIESQFDDDPDQSERYRLIEELCPSFLRDVADDILKCGRYLNILAKDGLSSSESNRKPVSGSAAELQFERDLDAEVVRGRVVALCTESSRRLLDHLVDQCALLHVLASLRAVMWLDTDDWLGRFMRSAGPELDKTVKDVLWHRVQPMFETALKDSYLDAYADMYSVEFVFYSLEEQIAAIVEVRADVPDEGAADSARPTNVSLMNRASALLPSDVDVSLSGWATMYVAANLQWPLSLVVDRLAITSYQIVFRRLLQCKHKHLMLRTLWRSIMFSRSEADKCLLPVCNALLMHVNAYLQYCIFSVIKPAAMEFESAVKTATSIECVRQAHERQLSEVMQACALTDEALVEHMGGLFALVEALCGRSQTASQVASQFNRLLRELQAVAPLLAGRTTSRANAAWLYFVNRAASGMIVMPESDVGTEDEIFTPGKQVSPI